MKQLVLIIVLCWGYSLFAQEKQSVYFEYKRAALTVTSKTTLDSLVRVLDPKKSYNVKVVGHTDSQGSDAYNMELSKRRANSVYAYLVAHGIHKSRLNVVWKGEAEPMVKNKLNGADNPNGRQQNRRVEVLFYKPIVEDRVYLRAPKEVQTVTASSGGSYSVEQYNTSTSMLANNVTALSSDGGVLQSGGMVTVCRESEENLDQPDTIRISLPTCSFNPDMTVWTPVEGSDGLTRWEDTGQPALYDPVAGAYYVTRIIPPESRCTKINFDLKLPPQQTLYVITTPGEYEKFDLDLGEQCQYQTTFAGKVNDTLYAFALPHAEDSLDWKSMMITATASINDEAYYVNERLMKFRSWFGADVYHQKGMARYVQLQMQLKQRKTVLYGDSILTLRLPKFSDQTIVMKLPEFGEEVKPMEEEGRVLTFRLPRNTIALLVITSSKGKKAYSLNQNMEALSGELQTENHIFAKLRKKDFERTDR